MKVFYRIIPRDDGLVDVYLTPGKPIPITDTLTGKIDYNIEILAVQGIDPDDAQWNGDLEWHIRNNYSAWCESTKVIEI